VTSSISRYGEAPSFTTEFVVEFTSRREARNIVHTIIGRPDPDVTLRGPGLRQGAMGIWCQDYASAVTLEALLASQAVLRLQETVLGIDLAFVCTGSIELRRDSTNTTRWLVRSDYQEVTP